MPRNERTTPDGEPPGKLRTVSLPQTGTTWIPPVPLWTAFLCVTIVLAAMTACSPPDDSDPHSIIGPTVCMDEWRDDTAHIRTTIRFEALVDTAHIRIDHFSGSGLRISLLCVPPEGDTLPYLDVYSISANYLDIPAAGLPFKADIPPEYFGQYGCARLAAALVLLYHDRNDNRRYDRGEPVFGADEQSLYAFVEGDLNTIPRDPFESVYPNSNVLICYHRDPERYFQSSPDFLATIFIISVRGETSPYDIPYPWPVASPLMP